MVNRRTLLRALPYAGALLGGGWMTAPWGAAAAEKKAPSSTKRFFSGINFGAQDSDQYHGASWFGKEDQPALRVDTGFRGHGAAAHPFRKGNALLFGRRPGRTCAELSAESGSVVRTFAATEGRHFCGHGCFSPDGAFLITTENVYEERRGVVGVRDAKSYQWLGEIDLGGIGPHEVRLLSDGNTLVVALGGILTHPDQGREKLNLDTMQPELIYLDLSAAKRIDGYRVADHHASIRHLAVATDDTVAVAMQYQRNASGHQESVALFGSHQGEDQIRLFDETLLVFDRMNDYLGSVEISNHNRVACATSPRGNQAAFWGLDSGKLLGMHRMNDVCGLAVTEDEHFFVLTNSHGEIRYLDTGTLKEEYSLRQQVEGVRWDNHLVRL